jgi:hypothetical protein
MSDPTVHSFHQFLSAIEGGQLHFELTDALREMIANLNQRFIDGDRSKAVARLDLSIALSIDAKSGTVDVDTDYKVKLPKKSRGRTVFWTTADNKLSMANPRQLTMELRDVSYDQQTGEIR